VQPISAAARRRRATVGMGPQSAVSTSSRSVPAAQAAISTRSSSTKPMLSRRRSPIVARIGRAHRNDLENLVLFAIAGGLYVATGGPRLAGFAYCGLFLLARLLHTFAYLVGRPMSRRNAYTLGFLVIVVISLHTPVVLIGLA
jgi:uncharacterized MAPEG superfamily protein